MKTLIIGEIINNNLSSGTLEILGKAKALDLDVQNEWNLINQSW